MIQIITAMLGCLALSMVGLSHGASPSGIQVLATVGNDAITIHDFLVLAPIAKALGQHGDNQVGKEKVLEGLIGQKLFAQEAVRQGLDQSPEVQAMLQQARVNILAQAYMRWRTAQGVSIADEQIEQYFKTHASEFQDRTLQEATAEIRTKLIAAALNDLLAQDQRELSRREGVTIDRQLLKDVPLIPPAK
jgi:EpsD family peptidyl-prolyl cis-trans isomerase